MLVDVSILECPSWFDVQDILREWIWNPKSIVDTEFGIGFGEDDWTFNFHESKDGIWYIDFYYVTTEIQYSMPVWRPDMSFNDVEIYRCNYNDFVEDFCRKEKW